MSLRLLMTHRSGLNDAAGYAWGTDTALRGVLTPGGRALRDGAAWRRDRAPGTWFSCINLNWGVIGMRLECRIARAPPTQCPEPAAISALSYRTRTAESPSPGSTTGTCARPPRWRAGLVEWCAGKGVKTV